MGDKVKDVVVSTRLIDSPSCVISDSNRMMTMQMRRILEASGQKIPDEKYTLLKKAAAEGDVERFKTWAQLIFEQALLSDQGALKDPSSFVKCMNKLLSE